MSSALEGMREPQRIEGGREAASAAITGGILGEAIQSGYAVDDRTLEAAQEAQAPAQEPEASPEPPPDPVDEIVEGLRLEELETNEDISDQMVEEEDDDQTPDFEAEADAELLNEEISADSDEGFEPEWVQEPEDQEARRRAIVAEKKAAYYEKRNAEIQRRKWEAEADKHFPLWKVKGEIRATSRRAFLREAKAANDAVKPFIKAAVKTREEQLEAERQNVRAEEKQKVAEAWGKPTVTQTSPTDHGIDFDAEIREARKNQDLAKVLSLKRLQAEAGGGEQE